MWGWIGFEALSAYEALCEHATATGQIVWTNGHDHRDELSRSIAVYAVQLANFA
jgi:hypothetical protein